MIGAYICKYSYIEVYAVHPAVHEALRRLFHDDGLAACRFHLGQILLYFFRLRSRGRSFLHVFIVAVIYGTYDPRLYTCGLKYLPYHKGSAGLSFSSRHSYGKQSFRRTSVKLCAHLRHSFSYVLGFDHRNFLVYLLRKTP